MTKDTVPPPPMPKDWDANAYHEKFMAEMVAEEIKFERFIKIISISTISIIATIFMVTFFMTKGLL